MAMTGIKQRMQWWMVMEMEGYYCHTGRS